MQVPIFEVKSLFYNWMKMASLFKLGGYTVQFFIECGSVPYGNFDGVINFFKIQSV